MTIIDPPSGWRYGFPKPIPEERRKDTAVWLVEQGYPQKLIDEYGEFFMCRYWEEPDQEDEAISTKQTAIEYFDEQIQERIIAKDTFTSNIIIEISFDDYMEIKKQAKQMGKEQLENARPQIISNCVIKEISDEEIEKEARKLANIEHNRPLDSEERYYKDYQKYDGIVIGMKWYREQLKKK